MRQAIELSRAYRGTTLLLGDVLEVDDEYTALHSRSVVSLSVAVADGMGLARSSAATSSSAPCCTTSARSPSEGDHQQAGPARPTTSGSVIRRTRSRASGCSTASAAC